MSFQFQFLNQKVKIEKGKGRILGKDIGTRLELVFLKKEFFHLN
jgi:hypothetical protein